MYWQTNRILPVSRLMTGAALWFDDMGRADYAHGMGRRPGGARLQD
jgi:hypothetical protein